MDERTRLLRDATRRPVGRRPVSPPIERATTLINGRAADLRDGATGPVYGIEPMQAHRALADALAELEGAERVAVVATGLLAVTAAVLSVVRAGDDVLASDAIYGPTRRFFDRWLPRYGVRVRYHPPRATPAEIEALLNPSTRLVFMESPGTSTFEMQDVPGIAAMARRHDVRTVVDNTWAAGLLFKPLAHGVDLSIQALSKYVGGHSDVFGGAVATADPRLSKAVADTIEDLGLYVSPDDAWLMLRGLRTLPVRMKQHGESALRVAEWLAARPEVAQVLYPPLPGAPDHDLWARDFNGGCGLMGVMLAEAPREAVLAFLDALELFGLGFSWGGFDSLATDQDYGLDQRRHGEARPGPLIRLHIGLEAPEDLIADLERGLEALNAAR